MTCSDYVLCQLNFLMAQWSRIHLPMQEIWVRSLGWKDPLEKEMATHPSIAVWRIPWMEEPGRLHTVHGVSKNWTQLINWTIINNSFTYSLFFSFHFSCYSFNIFKTEPWISLFFVPKALLLCSGCYGNLPQTGWLKQNKFILPWLLEVEVQDQSTGRSGSPEAPLPTLQAATSSLAFPRAFLYTCAFLGAQCAYNFFSV